MRFPEEPPDPVTYSDQLRMASLSSEKRGNIAKRVVGTKPFCLLRGILANWKLLLTGQLGRGCRGTEEGEFGLNLFEKGEGARGSFDPEYLRVKKPYQRMKTELGNFYERNLLINPFSFA